MVVHIRHDVDVEELRTRAFSFNRTNPNWVDNAEHNLYFLRMHQNVFNDMLIARGYVFLNDILSMIGLPECVDGNLVGWALNFQGPTHIEFTLVHDENPSNGVDVYFNVQDVILFHLREAHAISVSRFDIAQHQENA